MSSELLFGQLHPEIACAVALAIVEDPRVVANVDSLTFHDPGMRPLGTIAGWLNGDDPLRQATREYLQAKREASMTTMRGPGGGSGWAAASAARTRDAANQRARQARERGRALLAERGVLAYARNKGLKFIGVE
jgi:hypothetical protein